MGTFHIGGLERLVHVLARDGREKGIESTVFAFMEDGLFRRAFEADGIETRFFDKDPGVSLSLAPRLAFAARRFGADVLHAHHFGPYVYAAGAAKLTGIPLVYTEHSREVYTSGRRRALGKSMSRAATVVSVSHELDEWRRAEFGHATQIILNGVPLPSECSAEARASARDRLGLAPDALVVGAVARFMEEKDHPTMLHAFSLLARQVPEAQLVLVGGGPTFSMARHLVGDLELNDRVHFLGPRLDVERFHPAFDIITLSSTREGLPLALLEGMAAGAAAVATNVGEVGALIGTKCGALAPPSDPAALGAAYISIATDPERLHACKTASRARIIERYSSDVMVDRYASLYRDVVGRP
jgi:glycosyltransferase involved in cell wall biosynthesis